MKRLEVYRKRPRSWATDKGLHVKVNKTDAKRPEHRSRLCGKELKRWDPTMPGTSALMGPFGCVLFTLTKALMWKNGARCATARKILFWDASRTHCEFEAASEIAIELPPEEQVKGEDLIGWVTKSSAQLGEKVATIVDSGFVIGIWSPAIVCSRERELCRFVHGDDFIIAGGSVPLALIESRLNKGLILMRRAILGRDEGDDKTVTILHRFVT